MPAWKRAADLACAILALPLLALGALIMLLVTLLLSPGPVFFRQARIGHQGRRFSIYKFRTMRVDADPTVHKEHFHRLMRSQAPMLKLDAQRDARLIPGAWILRASGLDELPQILNVLCGDMSLVGPRPCVPSEWEQMTGAQRERCRTVPGLSGLWQVSGKNRTTFDEMIRLDIRYAQEISPIGDLMIVLRTPFALLTQMGDSLRNRKTAAQRLVAVGSALAVPPVGPRALVAAGL